MTKLIIINYKNYNIYLIEKMLNSTCAGKVKDGGEESSAFLEGRQKCTDMIAPFILEIA